MTPSDTAHGDTQGIHKAPTGIEGLDTVLSGGLPEGRPTLLVGGPGCGKTVIAMQFLVNGALMQDTPGVFVSFEESREDLEANFQALSIDLKTMEEQSQLRLHSIPLTRGELIEAGSYSLDGLFLQLGQALDSIGARRIVLDSLDSLFSALSDRERLRTELSRLFHWLKQRGVTAVVTSERGEVNLTRYGISDYVSDCVILLDHRVQHQLSKRRLRIVKYRGSEHGADEYPFLIGRKGVTVLPITSLRLEHGAPKTFVSSGIPDLDLMLGGKGYYEGSSVLVTGTAGTGKSTVAASFADSVAASGRRCLYFAFEESAQQHLRNMRSLGIGLGAHLRSGTLVFEARRPTTHGLEEHLLGMLQQIDTCRPDAVIFDPITNFVTVGSPNEVKAMLTRVLDHLKMRNITSLLTSLTPGSSPFNESTTAVSSLMDTWIVLRAEIDLEAKRQRRYAHVIKSRGMDHSLALGTLRFTSSGLRIEGAGETGREATA